MPTTRSMDVFAALADPTRRRIVELLARQELLAGQVAAHFDSTRPAISNHLKALRDAGLARCRVDAQRRVYSLDPAGLDALRIWADTQRRFWDEQLDRLGDRIRRDLAAGDLPPTMKGSTP
jgi:DNA-binding transcriptional ArsR family regulator